MGEQHSDPSIVILLGIIVMLLAVIIVGISADVTGDEQVSVESFEQEANNVSVEQTARIVSSEDGRVVIEGSIRGTSSGMEPVLRSIKETNNTINLNIRTEMKSSSEVVLPALQNYGYRVVLSNVNDKDDIRVSYGDESFNLSTQNNNSNNNTTMKNKTDPQFDFKNRGSDSASASDEVNMNRTEDEITINGVIVGNTGGQSPYLSNTEIDNSTITVDIGLREPDGFATQVLTGYRYELSVTDFEDYEDIVVEHKGERVENFSI